MLYIAGILGIVGLVIFFVAFFDTIQKKSIVVLVISLILIGVAVFQYSMFRTAVYKEVIETKVYKLIPLKDVMSFEGNAKEGRCYVYSSINGKDTYNFYYKASHGRLGKGTIAATKTVIYEQNMYKPVVIEYEVIEKCKLDENLQKIILFSTYEKKINKKYGIYVPVGTVLEEYQSEKTEKTL